MGSLVSSRCQKKKKNMLVGEFKSPLVVFECVKVYVPDAV